MAIYRKNVKIQMILFIAFLILGVNVFASYYIYPIANWYNYIVLGISLVFIVWAIFVYRKEDNQILEIDKKDYNQIRLALYSYFFVYVIYIALTYMDNINEFILSIVASTLLTMISVYGLIIHNKLLKRR